ncbi:ATP-binding protein [Streptomyces sp. NPDC003038]|uniref:ATP-binding protein n=1 Tax=unclassified Streptomyces TaxID=2593676 RepID=UPI0033A4B339
MNEAPPMPIVPAATTAPAYAETLTRKAEAAAVARRLVREALVAWQLPDLIDGATLVVSELVANAADHARGETIRVAVTRTRETRIRIAVVDRDPNRRPQLRAARLDADGGRGLVLVTAMSRAWGVHQMGWGKRVWADLEASADQEAT